MKMTVNNEWYQKTVSEVMQSLVTEDSGLTSDEAKSRLVRYGYNELKFKQRGVLVRFLLQFNSALIYVLLVAAAVTAILGMWIDAAVILVVVLANAIIGFIQEGKAEASMEAVTKMMVPVSTVLCCEITKRRIYHRESWFPEI
jgi:magnesium-transporting ATPase (P-type)